MKEMSRCRLGGVTQSLRGGRTAERPISTRAIECTGALLELYMYAQYKCHDDATLSNRQDTLHRVHTFKEVCLLGRAGKKAKAQANALGAELLSKRKVDDETHPEMWMPSKKWSKMNIRWDDIWHEIEVSKQLDADFNFPKIHLMSHWVKQIRSYGALQHYSAETHEQVHKTNLNDG